MTPFVGNLAGIAECARLLVRLCVLDPSRFHRHMAEEVHITLLEPVPSRSGEVISALFRPTVRIPLIADTHSKLIADSVPCDRGHPERGA